MRAIKKKIFGSGKKALKISNEEMNNIINVFKSLEESSLLMKGVSVTIKNEGKEQRGGFSGKLLSTLDASLLGNLVIGSGVFQASEGTVRAFEGTVRAGQDF